MKTSNGRLPCFSRTNWFGIGLRQNSWLIKLEENRKQMGGHCLPSWRGTIMTRQARFWKMAAFRKKPNPNVITHARAESRQIRTTMLLLFGLSDSGTFSSNPCLSTHLGHVVDQLETNQVTTSINADRSRDGQYNTKITEYRQKGKHCLANIDLIDSVIT